MRMNMDTDLKQAIDTNYTDSWDNFTVVQAIAAVGTLSNKLVIQLYTEKNFMDYVKVRVSKNLSKS